MTVALIVRLTVRSGSEPEFEGLISELRTRSIDAEPGLVAYDFFRGSEPSTYVGIEAFADRAAFREHQESVHHRELAGALEQVIADQHVEWIDPVAGASTMPMRFAEPRRRWWHVSESGA